MPWLLAGLLGLGNTLRRRRLARLAGGGLITAALWFSFRPAAYAVLVFAAQHPGLTFVAAAVHASSSVARRHARVVTETELSWLAPLPHRMPIPARLAVAPAVALLLLGIVVCVVTFAAGSPSDGHPSEATPWNTAGKVWIATFAGFSIGGLIGFWSQRKSKAASVAAQYAIVRRVRDRWASAPSLHPLSFWAPARTRALNNPRVSANTLIIVLLSIPMGTPGAVALAFAATWMIGLYALLNLAATLRTAVSAARWLAPTPVPFGRFSSTLVFRTFLGQLGVCVSAVVVAIVLNEPRFPVLASGAATAWLLFYGSVSAAVCWLARRPFC